MLQPVMYKLAQKRIVLASGSPRRKTILGNIVSIFQKILTYDIYFCINISNMFFNFFGNVDICCIIYRVDVCLSQLVSVVLVTIHVLRIFYSFQGLKFDVIPSTFEEDLDKSHFEHPYQYVIQTAKTKALEVAKKLRDTEVLFHFTFSSKI